jgi:hypothetical protein
MLELLYKWAMSHLVEGLGQHSQWKDLLRAAWLRGLNAEGEKKFSPYLSRPALGPNQPRVQWLLGPLAQECSIQGMMCTTHPSTAEVQHKWSYTCTSPLCPNWYITGLLLPSPFCRRNVTMGYDSANCCIGTDVAEEFAAFVCKMVHVCSYIPVYTASYTRGL